MKFSSENDITRRVSFTAGFQPPEYYEYGCGLKGDVWCLGLVTGYSSSCERTSSILNANNRIAAFGLLTGVFPFDKNPVNYEQAWWGMREFRARRVSSAGERP